MTSLFRALERKNVSYLLISGQACVLYGASEFTEDIDLWVEPRTRNARRCLEALASINARVYKLTPSFRVSLLKKGHGFHYRVGELYVDIMGRPPRVGDFSSALRRSRKINTDWGTLPVVSPEDLAQLKLTDRPADYGAVSGVVRMRARETDALNVLRWALRRTFDVTDLVEFALKAAPRMRRWPARPAVQALLPLPPGAVDVPESRISAASRRMALEMGALMGRSRRYWLPIVSELRELRRLGKLIPEGTPVASLLR
jgi:hypothetical protein